MLKKVKSRINQLLAILLPLSVVWCFAEAVNFVFSGACLTSYADAHGTGKITIIDDGFTDRRATVFLERNYRLPKRLFGFDPYKDGPFSFAWSTDGQWLQFRQGSENKIIDLSTGKQIPPEIPTEPIIFLTYENYHPTAGTTPWAIHEIWYDWD